MTHDLELVYPLYLDVPMLSSFIAALEDGIAYDSDVTQKQDKQKNTGAEGEGRFGFPALGSILGLDLRGKITQNHSTGDSEEIKVVRKHTEASLFIRLRHLLYMREQITKIGMSENLASVQHGSLIEVTGQISRNPLTDAFDGLYQVADLFDIDMPNTNQSKTLGDGSQKRKVGGNQQQRTKIAQFNPVNVDTNALGEKVLGQLVENLRNSKVKDAILRPSFAENISVVIGLTSEFLSQGAFENFLSGNFTVLGKVTRILNEGEEISLYQRTIMQLIDKVEADKALSGFLKFSWLSKSQATLSIKYPAIQIIPLAIFI